MLLSSYSLELGAAEAHLLTQVALSQRDDSVTERASERYLRVVVDASHCRGGFVSTELASTPHCGLRAGFVAVPGVVGVAVAAFPSRSLIESAVSLQRFREQELTRWHADREKLTHEIQLLGQTVQRTLELADAARNTEPETDRDALRAENEMLQRKLLDLQDRCHRLEEEEASAKEAERKLQHELLEIVQTASSREKTLQQRQEELRSVAEENRHRFEAMREQVKHFEDIAAQVQKKLDHVKQAEQSWRQEAEHRANALASQKELYETEVRSLKQAGAQWQRGLKCVTRAVFTFSRSWDEQCARLESKTYEQCRASEQRLSRVLQRCTESSQRLAWLRARGQNQAKLHVENLRARVRELEVHESAMKRRIQETEERSSHLERELERVEVTNAQLVRDLADVRRAWDIATNRERELHDKCERSKRELVLKEEALKEIQRSLESKENITNELFERVGVLEGQLLASREEQGREVQRSASKVQRAREDIVRRRILQEAQDFSLKLKQAADAQTELRSDLDARTTNTPTSATRSLASSPLS